MTDSSILRAASDRVGLPMFDVALLRDGENSVWRMGNGVVARISRSGDVDRVRRELQIARWLAVQGFPAVRPLPEVQQPVEVEGFAVSYWVDFGPHKKGTASQVAVLLRALHSLPAPSDFDLGHIDPFVRLEARTQAALVLEAAERNWLIGTIDELRVQWDSLPGFPERCLVHGDAWLGNVAQLPSGETLLLDLERSNLGPPEWDLVSTAIKLTSFGWLSSGEYREFCNLYGNDVTDSPYFVLLRDLRELRMTTYALQRANHEPDLIREALFRVRCLQGREGRRPWSWTPTG